MAKKQSLMGTSKDLMGAGVGLMAGHMVIGSMANIPGMPAQAAGTANLAHTGLNLVAVGYLAKTAMSIIPNTEVTSKKKSNSPYLNKMLG